MAFLRIWDFRLLNDAPFDSESDKSKARYEASQQVDVGSGCRADLQLYTRSIDNHHQHRYSGPMLPYNNLLTSGHIRSNMRLRIYRQ